MKAMLLTGFGGTDMLRYGDAPDPVAGPGEVVVDVHAASVNAADYKVRLGGATATLKFPHILGRDFSGVVSARRCRASPISRSATRCSASCDAGIEGAYAEKIAIKAAIVAKKPAEARPCRGGRDGADQPHRDLGARGHARSCKRGETILIQGGAGGVAGFAIQLAKHIGATVITTASAAQSRLCPQRSAPIG